MCPGWYGSSSSDNLDRDEVHHLFSSQRRKGMLGGIWMDEFFLSEDFCQ